MEDTKGSDHELENGDEEVDWTECMKSHTEVDNREIHMELTRVEYMGGVEQTTGDEEVGDDGEDAYRATPSRRSKESNPKKRRSSRGMRNERSIACSFRWLPQGFC